MSNLESTAVSMVKLALGKKSNVLKALIDENDRTPITDGHIEIYDPTRDPKSKQRNEAWDDRVFTQVRARSYRTPKAASAPYELTKGELQRYRKLGGILFFLVTRVGETYQIRYAMLNPFKIDSLLAGASESSGKIKVRTQVLPENIDDIIDIVKLQARTKAEADAIEYDEKIFGRITSFTIHSDLPLDISQPLDLDVGEMNISILATTESGVTLPTNMQATLMPNSYIGEEWDITVTGGDVSFIKPIRKQISPAVMALHLSAGLRITLEPGDGFLRGQFTIVTQSNLLARIKDLEFCLGIAETGFMLLGSQKIHLGEMGEHEAEVREEVEALKQFRDTLEKLGGDASHIDLEKVTEAERNAFDYLHRVIFEGEEMHEPFRQLGRVRQPVGGWALELLVLATDDDRGWEPISFLETGRYYAISGEDTESEERTLVTAYDILDQDQMERTINLNLGSIRVAYDSLVSYDAITGHAVNTVLTLIRAADSAKDRREEFLAAAYDLLEWLVENFADEPVYILNRLQIKARRGTLDSEDRLSLRNLRNDLGSRADSEGIQMRAGCSALLGDVDELEFLLNLLSAEDRALFESWPIARVLDATTEAKQITSHPGSGVSGVEVASGTSVTGS